MEEPLSFHIGPIRPPSEADSLLFQITNGCTWNKCRFCQLYKGTRFQTFSADQLKQDIDHMVKIAQRVESYRHSNGWDIAGLNEELQSKRNPQEHQCFFMMANWLIHGGRHVFLQDGNSVILRDGRLDDVLRYLKASFPQIDRITSYGRAENLSRLSADDFAQLKEAGLDRIHSGFETGSDAVLTYINKGVTQAQEITAGQNIKKGGIELSIYFMPGVGGRPLSKENAEETAKVLNAVNPDFFRIRTFVPKEGTSLYEDYVSGAHEACTDEEKLLEIRRVIELAEGIDTVIVSDHIVNLLEQVKGPMVADRDRLLGMIDAYVNLDSKDKMEYTLARRLGMVTAPDDMECLGFAQKQKLSAYGLCVDENEYERALTTLMARYV